MSDLGDFINLSVYASQRFDWVQSGGGNTSVQLEDGTFHVKASGLNMADVSLSKGHVQLNRTAVLNILKDDDILAISNLKQQEVQARSKLDQSVVGRSARASIESFMHVLFDKFTLHTHPAVGVNIISCQLDWRDKFRQIFPESLCVAYATPGFPLALSLSKAIFKYQQKHNKLPAITFIQNHGLIITAGDMQSVISLAENVSTRINKFLTQTDEPYIFTTALSRLLANVSGTHWVLLASNDQTIKGIVKNNINILGQQPFSPDGITFCGYKAVEVIDLEDDSSIREYFVKYQVMPKVLLFEGCVFCVGNTLRNARDVEDVLRFQLTVMRAVDKIHTLPIEEQNYLTHWEAEKYRLEL